MLLGIDSDGLLLVGGAAALLLALGLALLPVPGTLQAVAFLTLVAAGYGLMRRGLRREVGTPPGPLPLLRADEAEVTSPFAADGRGRVRWQGQSWAARNLEGSRPLGAGERVTVMGREGNCLQVMARGEVRRPDLPPSPPGRATEP